MVKLQSACPSVLPFYNGIMKPHSRRLTSSNDQASWLVYYPPGTQQAHHRHEKTQVSFLLCGCFEEESEGRTHRPLGRQVGVMPEGQGHSVRFGPDGALMLAIDYPEDLLPRDDMRRWRSFSARTSRQITLLGADQRSAADFAGDLLANLSGEAECMPIRPPNAPGWLRRAIAHIADEPDVAIADLAREAGVHRVYFSRRFQQCFGMSPTEFRLLRKSAAAMRRTIAGDVGLAQAAHEAGFADQAHWARTCRALAGIPPGQVRRLFAS